jgi:hypothetical protein
MQKARQSFQRNRARNVRDEILEKSWDREPQSSEKYSVLTWQRRLAQIAG